MRDRADVERLALVEEEDFDGVVLDVTLNLKGSAGVVLVGMAHDVVGGLIAGEDDGVGSRLVQAGYVADGSDEGPNQAEKAQIAGNGERPGHSVQGHAAA